MTPDIVPAGAAAGQQSVHLPAGVTVGPGRETTQTNTQGQVVQGMIFPITLPSGTMTSVFIPYTVLNNVSTVQQVFDQRIGAIMAVEG